MALNDRKIQILQAIINDYIESELQEVKVATEGIEEQEVEWDDLNELFLRMVVGE